MDLKKAYEDVLEFHQAFGHPVGDGVTPIAPDRCRTRVKWMREELDELIEADTLADQCDAIVDFIYFGVGGLVELGEGFPSPSLVWADVVSKATQFSKAARLVQKDRCDIAVTLSQMLTDIVEESATGSWRNQHSCFASACITASFLQTALGIELQPVWDLVHTANIAKLQPDGSVKYDATGKVVKPENWKRDFEPQLLIALEIESQVARRADSVQPAY